MTAEPVYPDAPDDLIATWNVRRRPLAFAEGEVLPPLDCDLAALAAARIPADEALARPASAHATKRHEIRSELAGHSELAGLNGLLIAHLRKRRFPRHTPRLFRRIWTEQGAVLLQDLPPRWLISSVITFGDHGQTEEQRRIGLSMNVMFSLMKLYEFERLYSGQPADRAFGLRRTRENRLPLDMPNFSLLSGGLDVNLLAPLWQMAQEEPVAGPIALHLLNALNEDPGNLFRRIGQMRGALTERRRNRRARAGGAKAEAAE
ncbi:hypothetical protein [Neotabrizicola sp. VNH66]|uniref:hypothetical protein n=1 Tax=Neotabrizicola sp. VNH66 TaxID=3400918 RepID=UPI003BFC3E28